MKKLVLLSLSILVLLGIIGCTKKNTDLHYKRKYTKEIKDARKDLSLFMIENMVPGANVAVSINGELVYSEGLGWASKDLDVPAKRSTKFRIGQVSTIINDAIYLKLVEEGKIDPDTSIQYYYPEFPTKPEGEITPKMLANEISGIRPSVGNEEMNMVNKSIEKGLEIFKDDPLDMPPGQFQINSCFNHNLLGVIMEKATGKKYTDLLNDYVTAPLNMDNTVIDNPFITIKGRADFYEPNIIAQVVNTKFTDLRVNTPSKGLLSNAEDLVKLGSAFLEGDFFSSETRKNLFEPLRLYNQNPSRMVNGWLVFKDNHGRVVYGLQGSVDGGSASVVIYPESKMVIAYACNLSSSLNETPVLLIANAFLGTREGKEQPSSKLK
ncbi:MAG TPA: serine hydrolase domain-containing protein [Draconibacterium sp.]|nr:serine hydrolase domain-containing protein [Draconibacterium sp.]